MFVQMQRLRYYIFSLMTIIMLCACADDTDVAERDVHFCIQAEWHEGRSSSQTRAANSNLLTTIAGDIDYYPETLIVKGSSDNREMFTLSKIDALCKTHGGYYYSPSIEITDVATLGLIKATTDDGEELSCTITQGDHVHFAMQHTQALFRFAFKVDEKYDQLRFIKITQMKLNNSICSLVEKSLNKDNATFIAYAYVDPAVVTTSYESTLACTYNIYDKDADFETPGKDNSSHLIREGVVATNTFTFSSLKNGGDAVSTIRSGYYYDLCVTLNPDYLYVLSEHDNKPLKVE